MKIKALGSLLAKQYGVAAAEGLAPGHHTLGDVTSPEELEALPGSEARRTKQSCVPESPEQFWERTNGALRVPPVDEWDTWPFDGALAVRPLESPVEAEDAATRRGRRRLLALRHGDETALWSNENWCVTPLGRPTGLPAVVILRDARALRLP